LQIKLSYGIFNKRNYLFVEEVMTKVLIAILPLIVVLCPFVITAEESSFKKDMQTAYNISMVPQTIIIDKKGKIRYSHYGYRYGMYLLLKMQVEKLLEE